MSSTEEFGAPQSRERSELRDSCTFLLRRIGKTASEAEARGPNWLKAVVYQGIDAECYVLEPKADGHTIERARRLVIVLARMGHETHPPMAWIEDTVLKQADPSSVFEISEVSFAPVDAQDERDLTPEVEELLGHENVPALPSEIDRRVALAQAAQARHWNDLMQSDFALTEYTSFR